jgi:DNA processing protein
LEKSLLQKSPKTDEEKLDWLQLARSENIGPHTFHQLLNKFGDPKTALNELPYIASKGGLKRPLKLVNRGEVEAEFKAIEDFGAKVLLITDPEYPHLLRHIESAPPIITVKGRIEFLKESLFAIVGARNASALGKKMAQRLSKELGEAGWIISSGLARGIDAAAHQGSLSSGTVAVLAGGINDIYPSENEGLYHQIASEGVLIAESPFGTKPQSTLFPRRNRIISGISRYVLVVEAAIKSGSLITTKYALEQGRDVFAIPGHPLDPRARGCNQLIKNGAALVEGIEDIMNEISEFKGNETQEEVAPCVSFEKTTVSDKNRNIVNENLNYIPISIDELIRQCQLSASEVGIILLEMELAGRLERHPGDRVSHKKEWKAI